MQIERGAFSAFFEYAVMSLFLKKTHQSKAYRFLKFRKVSQTLKNAESCSFGNLKIRLDIYS